MVILKKNLLHLNRPIKRLLFNMSQKIHESQNDKFISLMFSLDRIKNVFVNKTYGVTFNMYFRPTISRLINERKSESLIFFLFSSLLLLLTNEQRSIVTTYVYSGKRSFVFFARTEIVMSFSFTCLRHAKLVRTHLSK
jgi:hypothetical protein